MACFAQAFGRAHHAGTFCFGDAHHVVNYFSHRTGRPFPFTFTKGEQRLELIGRHVVSVNDSSANLAAGLAGLGIVRVSTFQAQPHIARGDLVPLLLDWCAGPVAIHVVYAPNRHLSTKVRVFVDWVAELFSRSNVIQRACCMPKGAPAKAAEGTPREHAVPAAAA